MSRGVMSGDVMSRGVMSGDVLSRDVMSRDVMSGRRSVRGGIVWGCKIRGCNVPGI